MSLWPDSVEQLISGRVVWQQPEKPSTRNKEIRNACLDHAAGTPGGRLPYFLSWFILSRGQAVGHEFGRCAMASADQERERAKSQRGAAANDRRLAASERAVTAEAMFDEHGLPKASKPRSRNARSETWDGAAARAGSMDAPHLPRSTPAFPLSVRPPHRCKTPLRVSLWHHETTERPTAAARLNWSSQ